MFITLGCTYNYIEMAAVSVRRSFLFFVRINYRRNIMYPRVLILLLLMLTIPLAANAAEAINDFEINVLPAEGQKDFSEGYFNVDSEPGQTLSLNFRVINTGDETLRLSAEAVDAHTAEGGGILYSVRPETADKDQLLLSDLLDVQDTVIIAPGGVEKVHVHIDIPESASGTLLGGIMLTDDNAAGELLLEPEKKSGSNYSFERVGQRLVAVKLNMPEKSASGFSLGKAKFNADRNVLTLKVANGKSAVLERVQGTYTILDKEGEELVSGVVEPFAMAPMSAIKFPIDLKGQLLEKGKYVLMIKGRADEKEFFAEEKFSVSEGEQEAIAGETAETPAAAFRGNISRTIAIALAAFFLLLPLFMKLDKRNAKDPLLKLSDK
ncbi:DUF916 domain-containing protein [Planococcus salinarum]|nr:DUF916 domain-containing protein [Planococcus salinarum]